MRTLCLLMGAFLLPCAIGFAAPKAAPVTKALTHKIAAQRWPVESLSGKVSMVDPQKDLVVVRDSGGTPFDFIVTHATRIDSGAKHEKLSQLSANTPVSIRFTPESRGDVANTINIGG